MTTINFSSSLLCGCCNDHSGEPTIEIGDRRSRRGRRNVGDEDEELWSDLGWSSRRSLLRLPHTSAIPRSSITPVLFPEAPFLGARQGVGCRRARRTLRPRAGRKMARILSPPSSVPCRPCVTPTSGEESQSLDTHTTVMRNDRGRR